MKVVLLFSLAFTCYTLVAMEQSTEQTVEVTEALTILDNFASIASLKAHCYTLLTTEEKDTLTPAHYSSNIEKGRTVLKKLATLMVNQAYTAGLITLDITLLPQVIERYSTRLIQLREAVAYNTPITVTNEWTARARAAQLLTNEEKNALQRSSYLADKQKALGVLRILARATYNELQNAQLLDSEVTLEAYVSQFIQEKLTHLDQAYSNT